MLTPDLPDADFIATINQSLANRSISTLSASDLGKFEEAVQNVYTDRCQGVMSYIRYLFPNSLEGTCSRAIAAVNAEKSRQTRELSEFINSLDDLTPSEKSKLTKAMEKIPTDALVSIYHLTNTDKTSLFKALKNYPQDCMMSCFRFLPNLLKGLDANDRCIIFKIWELGQPWSMERTNRAMAAFSPEKKKEFFTELQNTLAQTQNTTVRVAIQEALYYGPSEIKINLLRAINHVLRGKPDDERLRVWNNIRMLERAESRFITLISETNDPNFTSTIINSRELIEQLTESQRSQLVTSLARLPSHERASQLVVELR